MSQTAVAEVVEEVVAPAPPTPKKQEKPRRQPRYNVILWNDDDHTFEFVIKMLAELFGYPVERGLQLAMEVHTAGRAIVLTTTREHAELKRDQIHAYGKDPNVRACKGSLSASIEPMPS